MADPAGPAPVDYAAPADLPRERRRRPRTDRDTGGLWGGPARTALKAGCWLAAALGLVALLLPLLDDDRGADSPAEAVEQLLQGMTDLDGVAILAAVDPDETADPARAEAAYDRLAGRLLRVGETPPAAITDLLTAAEGQVGGSTSRDTLAALADVDLALRDLRLAEVPAGGAGGEVGVAVRGGSIRVDVGGADYTMPLAQGWRVDGDPIEPVLVAVERDGRWFVSLEATADALPGRP